MHFTSSYALYNYYVTNKETLNLEHIVSTHSVLLDILTVINIHSTQNVHILHYVHLYTQWYAKKKGNNNKKYKIKISCSRFYIGWIRNFMDVRCMVSSDSRWIVVFVQCVRVVQLNCVKVQCIL